MGKDAKKRCPKGVRITDTQLDKKYEPGQFLTKDLWHIFEQYVAQQCQIAAPEWTCETQVERPYENEGKTRKSRTDIEMVSKEKERILFECKLYSGSYLSRKDVTKIIRDKEVSESKSCYFVISQTTKLSAARKKELEEKEIGLLIANSGWEDKLPEIFGVVDDSAPGASKKEVKTRFIWEFIKENK